MPIRRISHRPDMPAVERDLFYQCSPGIPHEFSFRRLLSGEGVYLCRKCLVEVEKRDLKRVTD